MKRSMLIEKRPGLKLKQCLASVSFVSVAMATGLAFANSLEDAVRVSLQTNPDMGVVAENRLAVDQELEQAYGGYYPTLDLRAAAGLESTNNGSTRGRGEGTVNLPRYEASLNLVQILFDGYATYYEVERQKTRVISTARMAFETSQFIAFDAIQAYLEALRQNELLGLAEDNVRIHQQTLDLVRAKVSGGAATIADIQQAEARLATAQATLTDARGSVRDANATYSRVVGEDPSGLTRPVVPKWAMPVSVDAAIDQALEYNPTVNVARADLDTVRMEFRGSKAAYFPTITFESSVEANRNLDGNRTTGYGAQALVVMNYNLFNGFRDEARRAEVAARIGETRQLFNRALRLTEEETRISWNALESAKERVAAQRREVAANDRVRQTYRQQFDLGGRNLLDLLDSENEVFLSRQNLISSEFVEALGYYQVLNSTGALLASMDIADLASTRSRLDPIGRLELDHTKARVSNDPFGDGDDWLLDGPVSDSLDVTDGTLELDPLVGEVEEVILTPEQEPVSGVDEFDAELKAQQIGSQVPVGIREVRSDLDKSADYLDRVPYGLF